MIKLRHIVMGGLILALSGCNGTTAGTGTSSTGFRPTKITSVTASINNGVKKTEIKTFSYDSTGKATKTVSTSTSTDSSKTNKFTNEFSNFNSSNLPQSIKNMFNDSNFSNENTYDSHGYLTIVINTDSKGVTSTDNYTNSYDTKGNLTEIIATKDSSTTTYKYNSNNLISSSRRTLTNGTPSTNTFEYNSNNQMIKEISTDGNTTFIYNSNGQLTKTESKSFTTTFEYENKSCLFSGLLLEATYKHLQKSICKK